jgi:hypothetical protein
MTNSIQSLISQMNMARDLEHSKTYKHLFEQYGFATLDELKTELFDGISLTYRGQSMNVYEGRLKEGIVVSQHDIALIIDDKHIESSFFMGDDNTFKIYIYID